MELLIDLFKLNEYLLILQQETNRKLSIKQWKKATHKHKQVQASQRYSNFLLNCY
jgi:hypothetical protein